jgi:hypothetical protein
VRHVGRHALILLQSFLYALQAFYDFLQLRVHLVLFAGFDEKQGQGLEVIS